MLFFIQIFGIYYFLKTLDINIKLYKGNHIKLYFKFFRIFFEIVKGLQPKR